MSADLLRRAAKAMREAATEAEKSYYSPWHDEGNEVIDRKGYTLAEVVDFTEINYLTEHIASWHPAVALAVADSLDQQADYLERTNGAMDRAYGPDAPRFYNELLWGADRVARAYLGETP